QSPHRPRQCRNDFACVRAPVRAKRQRCGGCNRSRTQSNAMMTDQPDQRVREKFRADLEFMAAPVRESARLHYECAMKFADAGIKSLFTLNGGGLVALPAFIALLKIEPKQTASVWIIVAAAVFVFGLILAACTSLLGYFSAMAAVQ